jgi:hypothetical protein
MTPAKCDAKNPTTAEHKCAFPKGHAGAHTAIDDEGESLVWTDDQAEEILAQREISIKETEDAQREK